MLAELIGREVKFVPAFPQNAKDGGRPKFDQKPVSGVVTYVHEEHGWFMVTYGDNKLRECFHPCEIGNEVTLLG